MTVLCWDIDGTLLTTARAGIFAWQDAIGEVCRVECDIQDYPTSGLTDAEIARRLVEHVKADPALAEPLLRRYEELLPDRLRLRKGSVLRGVREILDSFSGNGDVVNVLLTGNTPAGAKAKLAHYDLERYFPLGAFCEGPGERVEIARRALTLAAERLGHDPDLDSVFVIGDTPHDVACALAIGARPIGVASGVFPAEELEEAGAWKVLPALPPPAEFRKLVGL
jgi:phosphoglycolate phosphatase-like HAD superfamily hydrolase